MVSNLLKSHGVRQLLGGALGMLVAAGLYVGMNMLPGSQVNKALLVDTTSNITNHAAQVRINDKTVTDGELARIADRAAQVASQLHAAAGDASSESSAAQASASQSPVTGHSDRNAWIAMRQARRDLATLYDAAPAAGSPTQSPEPSMAMHSSSSAYAAVNYSPPAATMTDKSNHLPSSGLGLDAIVFTAFVLALLGLTPERRRRFIAALRSAD